MQNQEQFRTPLKIVVLDGYTLNPGDLSWDELGSFGEVTIHDRTPQDLIIPRAAGCEIVLTNKTPLSGDTIRSLPSLKYIGVLALLKIPNCIITPHIAWAPLEARSRLMNIAVENLRSFLNGNPVNVVS